MDNETKNVNVTASLKLMNGDEVMQHVPDSVLSRIKKDDPHPVFAMMNIGYEGESSGSVDLPENISWFKQLWPLKAVKQLVNFLTGSKKPNVYEFHTDDENERVAVGSVVSGFKEVVYDVTHAIAVAYINNFNTRNRLETGFLDICSLEATCEFMQTDNPFKYAVKNVKSLTGIALGSSSVETPGFAEASIIAVVENMKKKDELEGKVKNMEDTSKPITMGQVKVWIQDSKIRPDQLFTVQDLTAVEAVVSAIKSDFEETLEKKENEVKDLKGKLEPFLKSQAGERAKTAVLGSKLLEKEEKKIVEYISNVINVDATGLDDEGLQKKVDEEILRQQELLKSLDVKVAVDTTSKSSTDVVDDKLKRDEDESSDKFYQNSENNELIPT